MNKILFLLSIILLQLHSAYGQNLVPNPSFETFSTCPFIFNQMNVATGWGSYGETPDYLNSCGTSWGAPNNIYGRQIPMGEGYAHFYTYNNAPPPNQRRFPERIGSALSAPLIIGQKYYVRFRVSLTETSGWATSKIGIRFFTQNYSQSSPAPTDSFMHVFTDSTITDTTNWIPIFGSFVADSAYTHFAIGTFYDSAGVPKTKLPYAGLALATYYLDDICISIDSSICSIMPKAGFASSDNTVCRDSCITFIDTSYAAPPVVKRWTITKSATVILDTIANSFSFCFNESGSYDVKLSLNNNDGFDSIIKANFIEVYQDPEVGFQDSSIFCDLDSATIGTTVDAASYLWSNNDTSQSIMINNEDTFFLDIVDLNGCRGSDTTITFFPNSPIILLPQDTMICYGDSIFIGVPDINLSYLWSNGQTESMIWLNNGGVWTLQATNSFGCTSSDSISISIIDTINALDVQDTSVCIDESIQLSVQAIENIIWLPDLYLDNATSNTPISTPLEDITYIAMLSNQCFIDSVEVNISVLGCNFDVFIPNGVVNSNGEPYKIFIQGDYQDINFEVFNSKGERVHEANSPQNQWHTDEMLPGVYTYSFKAVTNNTVERKTGNITIVQ